MIHYDLCWLGLDTNGLDPSHTREISGWSGSKTFGIGLNLDDPAWDHSFWRHTRFEVCLVISVDPDQVLLHAASGRSLYLYRSQMHLFL